MVQAHESTEAIFAEVSERLTMLALGGGGRLAPIFLAITVAIVLAIYLWRRPGQGFLAWAFPRAVWFHPSHRMDIKLWLFMMVFAGLIRLAAIATSTGIGALVAANVGEFQGTSNTAATGWHPIAIAILVFVTVDFCVYWHHRWHHVSRILWPFHAVHHSAEVMTPFTVNRKHPVYEIVGNMISSSALGLVMGLVLGVTVGKVEIATLAGINIVYYAFNVIGANLRHSHIWLSFGPIVERIIISPAQHQIHHSIDPRHHDKNYGEALALWDWMFGTLYIPSQPEVLQFGLADADGNRIKQPHPTLWTMLLEPFPASSRAIRAWLRRLDAQFRRRSG